MKQQVYLLSNCSNTFFSNLRIGDCYTSFPVVKCLNVEEDYLRFVFFWAEMHGTGTREGFLC